MARAIVIGADIGGLITAAVLARAGMEVTVLEAQAYSGGCASTCFYKGCRFYFHAMLAAAEAVISLICAVVRLVMPATPVMFQRFTHRKWGGVGGFSQTGLLRAPGPCLARNLWLVDDSIFSGQSTAVVAQSGLRMAQMALREMISPDGAFDFLDGSKGAST